MKVRLFLLLGIRARLLAVTANMTKIYYIVKASNMTMEATYLTLQMKEHYSSVDEAMKVLFGANTDIIPPESTIYRVEESSTDFNWPTVEVTIKMSPLTLEKE